MTWRRVEFSVEIHRQHGLPQTPQLRSSARGRSCDTCEAAHLLDLLVTIPRWLSRAWWLCEARQRGFSQVAWAGQLAKLHDRRSRTCRMHVSCASRERAGIGKSFMVTSAGHLPVDVIWRSSTSRSANLFGVVERGDSLTVQRICFLGDFLGLEPSSFTTATSSSFLLPPE